MLRRHLEDVAKIAGDITITVARLDQIARTGAGQPDDLGWWKGDDGFDPTRRPATNLAIRGTTDRSALAPYKTPPRLDAAERHDAAVGEIYGWVRVITGDRGVGPSTATTAGRTHPLAVACDWLADQLEYARHQPWADEAWPALLAACGELVRIVDQRAHGELVGMCHCGLAVYSDQTGPCRRCGEAVDLGLSLIHI